MVYSYVDNGLNRLNELKMGRGVMVNNKKFKYVTVKELNVPDGIDLEKSWSRNCKETTDTLDCFENGKLCCNCVLNDGVVFKAYKKSLKEKKLFSEKEIQEFALFHSKRMSGAYQSDSMFYVDVSYKEFMDGDSDKGVIRTGINGIN